MKKLFFFIAALTLTFTAQATVVECSPNTNAIAWWLTQGDTLVLADGEYVEDYSITFDKPGVCVKAAEGAKPVIKLTGEWTVFKLTATTTFDGITFDGGNVAKYFLATTGAEAGTLTLTNCEFKNWAYWAISNQFESAASIDSVIVDNCLFHDGLGSAIRFNDAAPEGKHSCNYLKVTNSTFYNIVSTEYAAVIQANSNGEATGEQNEVIIDHITLYNFDASQLGAIAMRKSSKLSITNSIIATPENKDQYAFYIYGGNVENTLYFNGKAKSGPTYTNCIEGKDPMFVDAANGNFALAEGSPALGAATDGSNLGDPRWNKPAVVEPTYEVMELTMTNLKVSNEGEATGLWAADLSNGIEVMLFLDAEGNLMPESSINVNWMDYPVTGTVEKSYSEELGTDVYVAVLYVALGDSNYKLTITMYYVPVEATPVVVENATIDDQSETAGFMYMKGEWTDAEGTVYPVTAEVPNFDATVAEAVYENVTVTVGGMGDNDPWLGFVQGDVTITIVENVVTLVGTAMSSWDDLVLDVTISGKLAQDPTGVENINGAIAPVKMIENGQIFIIRNGVKFNAQGAIVK